MRGTRLGVWPPLPPGAHVMPVRSCLPFPLREHGDAVLYARARHGLAEGVVALGLEPGDEVLVPAYHHGSEIEALLRRGLVCRPYRATDDLAPDPEELDGLLGPRTRALYLTHHLGLPQDVRRWRRWCTERGLLLFEDAAQAWLAIAGDRPVGSYGDLAVFCLYKTVAIPDGAALLVRGVPPAPGAGGLGARALLSAHRRWGIERIPALAKLLAAPGAYDAVADMALGEPTGPSAVSLRLLPRLADLHAADVRRRNYRMLLGELEDLVPPPFDHLPSGASPFAFPIAVSDKARVLDGLAEAGVGGMDLWREGHPNVRADPTAERRRATTVALPVHQELRPADLERIVTAVRSTLPRPRAGTDGLGALRSAWSELAEAAGNVFGTWEWARTWLDHLGRGARVRLAVAKDRGAVVALLPLVRSSVGPVPASRLVGHGPADRLGDLVLPGYGPALADLVDELRPERDGHLLLGEQVPADVAWMPADGDPRLRVLGSEPSPLLRLERYGSWDGYLAGRSRNLRQSIRRRERALEREHRVSFRLADDPARLDDDLSTFFALHEQRWGREASTFLRDEAFHRGFAKVAAERGWLRLWLLELDGRPAAAWFGFRFGGADAFYQSGRHHRWDRASLGLVLHAHAIRTAFDDGISEYRFLRGAEPYKLRLADADRPLRTVAVATGPLGRAAVAGGAALARVPVARRIGGRVLQGRAA